MELLLNAINEFKNRNTIQQSLYNKLINKGLHFHFYVLRYADVNSAFGGYKPSGVKSIWFRDNSSINEAILREELIRSWQDAFYPEGINQYGKDSEGNKLPVNDNIEFEAKVLQDLLAGEYGQTMAFKGADEGEERVIYFDYLKWLFTVRRNLKILEDSKVYNYWLNLFIKYNKEYTGPKSDDFSSFHCIDDLIKK